MPGGRADRSELARGPNGRILCRWCNLETPRGRVTNILRLSLEQLDRSDGRKCRPLAGPTDRILRAGQSLVVHGAVAVQLSPPDDSPRSGFLPFGTTAFDRQDHTLVAVAQPLALRIVPRSTGAGAC